MPGFKGLVLSHKNDVIRILVTVYLFLCIIWVLWNNIFWILWALNCIIFWILWVLKCIIFWILWGLNCILGEIKLLVYIVLFQTSYVVFVILAGIFIATLADIPKNEFFVILVFGGIICHLMWLFWCYLLNWICIFGAMDNIGRKTVISLLVISMIYRLVCVCINTYRKWSTMIKYRIWKIKYKLITEWSNKEVKQWLFNLKISKRMNRQDWENISGHDLMHMSNKKLRKKIPNKTLRKMFKKELHKVQNKVFPINITVKKDNIITINVVKEMMIYEVKYMLLQKIKHRGSMEHLQLRQHTHILSDDVTLESCDIMDGRNLLMATFMVAEGKDIFISPRFDEIYQNVSLFLYEIFIMFKNNIHSYPIFVSIYFIFNSLFLFPNIFKSI